MNENDPKSSEDRMVSDNPVHPYEKEAAYAAEALWDGAGGFFSRLAYRLAVWICPKILEELYYKSITIIACKELLRESEHQRQIDIDARHVLLGEACAWRLKFKLAEKRNKVLTMLTNIQNEQN
tara:strand:- start:529 stop:900 length:372 start_codon:yes stop_codon:yes gene_type:complete